MKSIKKKLLFGFSIIIVLVITLGVMGLYEMSIVNNNVKSMYYDQLLGVNYIKDAQYYIALVQRAEKNIILYLH